MGCRITWVRFVEKGVIEGFIEGKGGGGINPITKCQQNMAWR